MSLDLYVQGVLVDHLFSGELAEDQMGWRILQVEVLMAGHIHQVVEHLVSYNGCEEVGDLVGDRSHLEVLKGVGSPAVRMGKGNPVEGLEMALMVVHKSTYNKEIVILGRD